MRSNEVVVTLQLASFACESPSVTPSVLFLPPQVGVAGRRTIASAALLAG